MLPMRDERTTTKTEDRATQPMEAGAWDDIWLYTGDQINVKDDTRNIAF